MGGRFYPKQGEWSDNNQADSLATSLSIPGGHSGLPQVQAAPSTHELHLIEAAHKAWEVHLKRLRNATWKHAFYSEEMKDLIETLLK